MIEERGGFRFHVRGDADVLVVNEALGNLETPADGYGLRGRTVRPGGLVVDVGAHIGTFSVRAASLFPTATVVAIEPDADNFQLLLRNVAENGLDGRVECRREALWLDDHGAFVSGESGLARTSGIGLGDRVPSVTLEQLLDGRRCGLLKIDCEGAEVPSILATPVSVLRLVDSIVGEFHELTPDWGAWVRHLAGTFTLTINAHDAPNHVYWGTFEGTRRTAG